MYGLNIFFSYKAYKIRGEVIDERVIHDMFTEYFFKYYFLYKYNIIFIKKMFLKLFLT